MINSQFILKCRSCKKQFFSNNKLHRHIKTSHNRDTNAKSSKIIQIVFHVILFVVKSINKAKNYRSFVFRSHRYAIAKKSLISNELIHDFCMNSDIFMFLIDRMFLERNLFHVIKHRISSAIKIRNIKFKIHDNFEYAVVNLYLKKNVTKKSRRHISKQNFIWWMN